MICAALANGHSARLVDTDYYLYTVLSIYLYLYLFVDKNNPSIKQNIRFKFM